MYWLWSWFLNYHWFYLFRLWRFDSSFWRRINKQQRCIVLSWRVINKRQRCIVLSWRVINKQQRCIVLSWRVINKQQRCIVLSWRVINKRQKCVHCVIPVIKLLPNIFLDWFNNSKIIVIVSFARFLKVSSARFNGKMKLTMKCYHEISILKCNGDNRNLDWLNRFFFSVVPDWMGHCFLMILKVPSNC